MSRALGNKALKRMIEQQPSKCKKAMRLIFFITAFSGRAGDTVHGRFKITMSFLINLLGGEAAGWAGAGLVVSIQE